MIKFDFFIQPVFGPVIAFNMFSITRYQIKERMYNCISVLNFNIIWHYAVEEKRWEKCASRL